MNNENNIQNDWPSFFKTLFNKKNAIIYFVVYSLHVLFLEGGSPLPIAGSAQTLSVSNGHVI